MAHKRLIAFMLATMLATATLTGCEVEKTEEEISYFMKNQKMWKELKV